MICSALVLYDPAMALYVPREESDDQRVKGVVVRWVKLRV
jgi:hypothetical protein